MRRNGPQNAETTLHGSGIPEIFGQLHLGRLDIDRSGMNSSWMKVVGLVAVCSLLLQPELDLADIQSFKATLERLFLRFEETARLCACPANSSPAQLRRKSDSTRRVDGGETAKPSGSGRAKLSSNQMCLTGARKPQMRHADHGSARGRKLWTLVRQASGRPVGLRRGLGRNETPRNLHPSLRLPIMV